MKLLPLIGLFLVSCRIEQGWIFHPVAALVAAPDEIGMPYEEVFFTASDGVRLHGWFVPHPEASATLLWFHGNAGNISHRLDNIRRLREHVKAHVFIFDYRGYGRSEGRPSEQGTYLDGTAAATYLRERRGIPPERTILFGRSLGAAIAAEVALRAEASALILETPFISVPEMARTLVPFLPVGQLLRTRYDTLEKVKRIELPLLILHGDRDEIVPFGHAERIFAAAREPKFFHTIAGARHNDTFLVGGPSYFKALASFVEWVRERTAAGKRFPVGDGSGQSPRQSEAG